jgi:hypothetical protein
MMTVAEQIANTKEKITHLREHILASQKAFMVHRDRMSYVELSMEMKRIEKCQSILKKLDLSIR